MCHLLTNLTSLLQKSGLLQLAEMPEASSQSLVLLQHQQFIVTLKDNALIAH